MMIILEEQHQYGRILSYLLLATSAFNYILNVIFAGVLSVYNILSSRIIILHLVELNLDLTLF
jgi:hypothetical protein